MQIKKRNLEIILQSLDIAPSEDISLEQYPTPIQLVSEILFIAESRFHDISNKIVVDLGCGSGFFAIGSALMGAKLSLGIDKSWRAISISKRNSMKLNLNNTAWIFSDVFFMPLDSTVDTVFQNPPFGIHRRGADIKFLEFALEISKVIYTIHKSGNYRYLKKFIESHNGKISDIWTKQFPIRALYPFHKHEKYVFDVDIYRIITR